jgi:hypothetical protein
MRDFTVRQTDNKTDGEQGIFPRPGLRSAFHTQTRGERESKLARNARAARKALMHPPAHRPISCASSESVLAWREPREIVERPHSLCHNYRARAKAFRTNSDTGTA